MTVGQTGAVATSVLASLVFNLFKRGGVASLRPSASLTLMSVRHELPVSRLYMADL